MKSAWIVVGVGVVVSSVSGCAANADVEPEPAESSESSLSLPLGWASGVQNAPLSTDGSETTFATANGRALECPSSPEFVRTARGGCRHLPSNQEFFAWAMVSKAQFFNCLWDVSVTHSTPGTSFPSPSTAIFTSHDGASFRYHQTVQSLIWKQTATLRLSYNWPAPEELHVLVVRTASTPWNGSPLRWHEVSIRTDSTSCI